MNSPQTSLTQDQQDDLLLEQGKTLWFFTDTKEPDLWAAKGVGAPMSASIRYSRAQARRSAKEGLVDDAEFWEKHAADLELHERTHGANCVG